MKQIKETERWFFEIVAKIDKSLNKLRKTGRIKSLKLEIKVGELLPVLQKYKAP